ncbi:MAG: 6-phosphogluconolactonase [Sphingomonadaceae bacterium]
MIEAEWWEYDDADEWAEAVAGDVGFLIDQALDARGNAIVAFPGGPIPEPVFALLAKSTRKWKHVTIIPTDERLVPLTDKSSNARMLAQHFLPAGARVLPLYGGTISDPAGAARAASDTLADMHWPLDLVWLGVGDDGHTASIFPGPDYDEALTTPHRVVGVTPDPMPKDAPVARISLSKSAILSARAITITLTGPKSRAALERALEDGDSATTPVGRVLADASQAIDIHWAP